MYVYLYVHMRICVHIYIHTGVCVYVFIYKVLLHTYEQWKCAESRSMPGPVGRGPTTLGLCLSIQQAKVNNIIINFKAGGLASSFFERDSRA